MQIKTLEVAGIASAIHAMRNPLDSWAKSDTMRGHVGKADKELSTRLSKAGTEHCKHLRMVVAYADITAPLYWWKQADCYRMGVEKVSTSTMHTLMRRPLTTDDFEKDAMPNLFLEEVIGWINSMMDSYKASDNPEEKKHIWRGVIQILPESFLQKRTVMMSYAALRNIYRQREGHKLKEWQQFREWVETLPESWMITDKLPEEGDDD